MSDDIFAEFDAMFAEAARKARPGGFSPNADVFLSDDGRTLVVHVEIAGAEPSELRVVVEARRLYILGSRIDRARTRGSFLMKEIAYGDFVKKLHLPIPVAVSGSEASAAYRDGMLMITLPVSERALPPARTEIRMTVRRTLV